MLFVAGSQPAQSLAITPCFLEVVRVSSGMAIGREEAPVSLILLLVIPITDSNHKQEDRGSKSQYKKS